MTIKQTDQTMAVAVAARPDVATLNPTLTGHSQLLVNYIAISRDDPLAFKFSDRESLPRAFSARILGGKPRFAASTKKPPKEWRNFPDNDSMQSFVDEHNDWQAVKRYILALRLPGINENYVFDLPFTSSIAFWGYAEGLAKEGIPVANVLTRFAIERVPQRSDPTVVFSRVVFSMERPLTDSEMQTMGTVASKALVVEDEEGTEFADEESVETFPEASQEERIRAANETIYAELIALPFGVGKKTGKPAPLSREYWDKKCVNKWGHLYADPIFGFSDLGVEHQAEMLELLQGMAKDKGLA